MPVDRSALGSVATSLGELLDRLHHLAIDATDDDDLGNELREVERQLDTAARRLEKALRR